MKIIISMLVCCFVFAGVQAQKITRDYNNVSLSEALRQLNEQTEEYTISFLYNELEDFRITTSVHRKTVPDAIRQMIGFYPIRMTVEPGSSVRRRRPSATRVLSSTSKVSPWPTPTSPCFRLRIPR